LDNEMII